MTKVLSSDCLSSDNSIDTSSTILNMTTPQHQQEQEEQQQDQQKKRYATAKHGDIVTIQLDMKPENGFVPEPLFDTSGIISLIVGKGNYLPGLHTLVTGMKENEEITNVSIDAGWGSRKNDLIISVPKTNLRKVESIDSIKVGSILNLQGGIKVNVINVTDTTIVVDANHPFAGSSYLCSLKVLSIDPFPTSKMLYHTNDHDNITTTITNNDNNDETTYPSSKTPSTSSSLSSSSSKYEVATWALGCFWGGELAFMRVPGVVGTRVGYTQGNKSDPTYEEVSSGTTQHREAIMVIYDPTIVTYKELTSIYMERLQATTSQYKIELFHEEYFSKQYQHGIYYHTNEQRIIAEELINNDTKNNKHYQIEIRKATLFYDAEEYHQQYLLKGGQSAKKNARTTIRCFG